jgi:hypothetical protein
MGWQIAREITDAHENILYGRDHGVKNKKARKMDLANNRSGIRIAKAIPRGSYTGLLGIPRQPALRSLISSACRSAVRREELTWYK